MRRVLYISGTRADFGLMRRTLAAIDQSAELELGVLVTSMHLDPVYGETVREIEDAGFAIVERVPVPLSPTTGATMARGLGTMVSEFTDAMGYWKPDLILLLGDRGEMLAGAICGIHLNVPVAHIHGGERSGTIDEAVRHAISKLSHIHLPATQESAERLIAMGEERANIHVVGAPGLDGLTDIDTSGFADFLATTGLDPDHPFALVVFHPVVQEECAGEKQMEAVLDALGQAGIAVLALQPNADAGSEAIRSVLARREKPGKLAVLRHLERSQFVGAMARCAVMVGNSSAGIIEAGSFGTPVVNIGSRQNLRERNPNVRDVSTESSEIAQAIDAALEGGRFSSDNRYGDGQTAGRIVRLLESLPLGRELLDKVNSY